MPIQYVKNVQFSRLIKAEGRLREFNFRKTGSGNEERCSVDTVDDRGNRIIFAMFREGGAWKLSSTLLPKWICQYEEQLNEAIEDESSHY